MYSLCEIASWQSKMATAANSEEQFLCDIT